MKKTFSKGSRAINAAHRQCGASLLEGIAYLGIAAIVILGAISLLMTAFGGAESNRLIEEVTSIRTSVRKLFMSQPAGFGAASTNLNLDLARANAFPTTLRITVAGGAATVNNSWNGAVTVAAGSSPNFFTITYVGVPGDVCTNAVSGSTGWIDLWVNGTQLAVPATPATAADACNSSSNTIQWSST